MEILQIGINGILNLGSAAKIILNSTLHKANQCRNCGVKDVIILSLTCSTLTNSELVNDVNNAIQNKCQTFAYHFIDNSNVTTDTLWKNG